MLKLCYVSKDCKRWKEIRENKRRMEQEYYQHKEKNNAMCLVQLASYSYNGNIIFYKCKIYMNLKKNIVNLYGDIKKLVNIVIKYIN